MISTSLVPDMLFPATASIIAERIGARQRRRLRRAVGLHRLRLRARRGHRLRGAGIYRQRARHRRRGAQQGARLERPLHLRAVRRRRRRGAGQRAATTAALFSFDLGNDGTRHAVPQHAGRRHPAAGQPRDGRRAPALPADERPRGLPLRHAPGGRVVPAHARPTPACSAADVDLFVPHQANLRIIEKVADQLGFGEEQVFYNLDRYGNTSCASIPLCLHDAHGAGSPEEGRHAADGRVRRRPHLGLVPDEVASMRSSIARHVPRPGLAGRGHGPRALRRHRRPAAPPTTRRARRSATTSPRLPLRGAPPRSWRRPTSPSRRCSTHSIAAAARCSTRGRLRRSTSPSATAWASTRRWWPPARSASPTRSRSCRRAARRWPPPPRAARAAWPPCSASTDDAVEELCARHRRRLAGQLQLRPARSS